MAYNPLPTAKLCKKTEVKKLYNLCSNFYRDSYKNWLSNIGSPLLAKMVNVCRGYRHAHHMR